MTKFEVVPEFNTYYPSKDVMNKTQLSFYRNVESKLNNGLYIDVEGNISYIFVYLYKLLSKWNENGYENLTQFLIYISELYKHEKKLSDYCLFWAYDCLLGLKQYELYLEKTEPKSPFGFSTNSSNLRLNIQRKIGIEPDPMDILLMAGGRKTKFIINNEALYKDKIREVFLSFSSEKGGWFKIIDSWNYDNKTYPHYLFSGVPIFDKPEMDFQVYAYYSAYKSFDIIKNLAKDAENLVRKEIGVPQIGEGWVSETDLFKKLEKEFYTTIVIQHGQPKWLGRQHFDIWFPNWNIAVEYHGKQHFEPVDFFGGVESFEKTVERDLRKISLSKKNGVKLFVVTEDYILDDLVKEIQEFISKRNIIIPNLSKF